MRIGTAPAATAAAILAMAATATTAPPAAADDGPGSSTCMLIDARAGHRAGPYRTGDLYPLILNVYPGARASSQAGPDAEVRGSGSLPYAGWARFLLDGREVGRSQVLDAGGVLLGSHSVRIPSSGPHVFVVEYLGTERYAPCRIEREDTVSRAFSLVDLWAVPEGDRSDRVTVRLRSPYLFPTGRLALFRGDDRFVGSASLSGQHTATFTVDRQSGQATALTLRYAGDPEHEAVDHRVDLPRRVLNGRGIALTATTGDVYWTEQAVATVEAGGPLPPGSSLAVVEVTPRDADDPTPPTVTCPGARWCHVTLDPRRGTHGFQGRQVLDSGAVLRTTPTRNVYWWW